MKQLKYAAGDVDLKLPPLVPDGEPSLNDTNDEVDDADDEQKFPRAAEAWIADEAEMIRVLEDAIEAQNTEVIDQILGLQR